MARQLSMPYLFDHLNTENGTRKNPFLLHLTSGQKDNSRVFHFKESRKYFQYHILEENAKPHEIRAYNQQWCRFGPGEVLARAFRNEQT